MTAPLWLVTNQFVGNGAEGVLVEAAVEADALAAAKDALRADWDADHHGVSIDECKWWVTAISLPYVGEFG